MMLFIFVAVVALNSCSREEVKAREEFSTPEKAYRFWLETAGKGDIESNMMSVTRASKTIMDSQLRNMDVFMGRLKENVRVFKTYTLLEQRSKEDRAVVVLKGTKGDMIVIPLKKEAEGWKIDLVSLFGGG